MTFLKSCAMIKTTSLSSTLIYLTFRNKQKLLVNQSETPKVWNVYRPFVKFNIIKSQKQNENSDVVNIPESILNLTGGNADPNTIFSQDLNKGSVSTSAFIYSTFLLHQYEI